MSVEPFAYAIQAPIGSVTPLFHKRKDAEDYIAKLTDSRDEAKIIPLYRASPAVETMLECWRKTIARDAAQEAEIARLRLTDKEREALNAILSALYSTDYAEEYVTLRGLLERLGGGE